MLRRPLYIGQRTIGVDFDHREAGGADVCDQARVNLTLEGRQQWVMQADRDSEWSRCRS
jgi:hypothetical protein